MGLILEKAEVIEELQTLLEKVDENLKKRDDGWVYSLDLTIKEYETIVALKVLFKEELAIKKQEIINLASWGGEMSEHFLKLDPNNYNTELEYLLDNDIFNFEDYKEFYTSGKISKEDFETVKDFYGCL